MSRPLCFVLMPFGQKPGSGGAMIDFDAVHRDVIIPAVEAAGLEPIRADEEMVGGIIHKPMFERLILCDYAVADLTTANANVFYELGVRHAVRPASTVSIFASNERLPFDVEPLRAIPYALGADGAPSDIDGTRELIASRLREARAAATDSPLYQLLDGMQQQRLDHEKTDVFREQVRYSSERKAELAAARAQKDLDAVKAIEERLGDLDDAESGVVVDLFLSYRALSAWEEMIRVAGAMATPLAQTTMMQEQVALAMNRAGRSDEAERILTALLAQRGASSETYGLLGRVYKDRWQRASKAGNVVLARGLLKKAIDAYRKGFETDWRDFYPGINAVTLMEMADPPDERRAEILPVVEYAVRRKVDAGEPDYWDHATLLELAVLAGDEDAAHITLGDALAAMREDWEGGTTANNLGLIRAAREARGESSAWIEEIEQALAQGAG